MLTMPTSIESSARRLLGVALFIGLTLTPVSAQWAVVNLHPDDPGVVDSHALAVQDGQQVGYTRVAGTFLDHAAVWSGTATSWVDLHPAGANHSRANAVAGGKQAGFVQIGGIGGTNHACLWSGTVATFSDLHPAGAIGSFALGSFGGTQVGYASFGADNHGGLWSGTAGSWQDLHPASAFSSYLYDTDGTQQVGLAYLDANSRASVWSGTAGSWVDLHPNAALASRANAVHGGQQVGWGIYPIARRAHLWSGTKNSLVSLHPAGAGQSWAQGVHGGQQVGTATVGPNGLEHAALWSGTAASWVDLHSFLPPGYTVSEAFGIWHSGNVTYVVGYGFNTAVMHFEALMWVSPPEAAVWTNLGAALPGASGAPQLSGTGTLVAGAPASLSLSNAAPSALARLFISLSSTPTPFKGGTLVPVPPLSTLTVVTNAAGAMPLSLAAWPPGASGASFWFQYAIQDAGAVKGVALSNALRADVP